MKRAAVLLLMLSSLACLAQQPAVQTPAPGPAASQAASADDMKNLVEAMHIRKNMAEMQQTMLDQWIKPMVDKMSADSLKSLTPEQRKKFDSIMNDMMTEALGSYPPDELIGDMIPIYQKYLDKADVEAMVVFYSSPSGQKFLDNQPKIIRDYMSVVMPKMQERMAAAVQKMQDRIRELAEESSPPQSKPKPRKPAPARN